MEILKDKDCTKDTPVKIYLLINGSIRLGHFMVQKVGHVDRKGKGDKLNNRYNPKYNSEGYADPTAYFGTKDVIKAELDADKRANDLIHVLKYIVKQSGFELIERVQVRDKQSRREYR